jgi:hypothetical protein
MVEQTIAPVKKQTNGALRRWEPFDMFETLQQEMERIWHRPFSFPFGPLTAFSQLPTKVGMTFAPRMDVFEKDHTLVFKAELPGLKKDTWLFCASTGASRKSPSGSTRSTSGGFFSTSPVGVETIRGITASPCNYPVRQPVTPLTGPAFHTFPPDQTCHAGCGSGYGPQSARNG